MPRPIGVIQIPGKFDSLLRDLGVNRPTQPFVLDGDVVPVILVDSGVAFTAAPTPAYRVQDVFTAGVQVNPAAGAILADTGQLPLGIYSLQVFIDAREQNSYTFEWRDAANAVNLWVQTLGALDDQGLIFSVRISVDNDNERFRVRTGAASGVFNYQATILARI